jgi:hypothetical protein
VIKEIIVMVEMTSVKSTLTGVRGVLLIKSGQRSDKINNNPMLETASSRIIQEMAKCMVQSVQ